MHFAAYHHPVLILSQANLTAEQKYNSFTSEQRLISALCVDFAKATSQEQMCYQTNLLLSFVSHTLYQTDY